MSNEIRENKLEELCNLLNGKNLEKIFEFKKKQVTFINKLISNRNYKFVYLFLNHFNEYKGFDTLDEYISMLNIHGYKVGDVVRVIDQNLEYKLDTYNIEKEISRYDPLYWRFEFEIVEVFDDAFVIKSLLLNKYFLFSKEGVVKFKPF